VIGFVVQAISLQNFRFISLVQVGDLFPDIH
jgi:hypothetical protein